MIKFLVDLTLWSYWQLLDVFDIKHKVGKALPFDFGSRILAVKIFFRLIDALFPKVIELQISL